MSLTNYAKNLPIDRAGNTLQEFPAAASSLGTYAKDNASTSSVLNLTSNTTTIEVGAVTTAAVIRWVSQTDTTAGSSVISAQGTANFDHIIPANTYRRFVVPRFTGQLSNYNGVGSPSIVGLNTQEGLYNAVAVKSTGIGSVLLTQF